MDIDAVFAEVGDFGWQQKKYCLLISLMNFYVALIILQYAIVGKDVAFFCSSSSSPQAFLKCPTSDQPPCESFTYGVAGFNGSLQNNATYKDESKGSGISSAKASVHQSIVSEWNLVCQRSWLKPLTMSIFMLGVLFGCAIFGNLADRIGRKPVMAFTMASLIACNVVCGFAHSFELYCLFRGFCGYFSGGHITSISVLYNELIGSSKRGAAGFVFQVAFSSGIVVTAALGYYFNGWRHFILATSLLGLPVVVITPLVPESPRWLVSRRKYGQADVIIAKIVTGNGKEYKDRYRQTPPSQSLEEDREDLNLDYAGTASSLHQSNEISVLDMLLLKETRLMVLVTFWAWFVCGIGYYAITLASASNLAGSMYTNLALSGLVEIPAAALSMFAMEYGRRLTVTFVFSSWGVIGIGFLVTAALPFLRNGFVLYCKSCSSAGFSLLYIITGEIFPTSSRNTSVGYSSTIARIGCIAAPFLNEIGSIVPDLNFVLLGTMALLTGVAWYKTIPETQGQGLPDNVQDILKMKAETRKLSLGDIWRWRRQKPDAGEVIEYSMLQQSDSGPAVFGNESFENVNFDYDDFSSEDELSDFEANSKNTRA